jgi:hypothetical protein
MAKIPKGQIEWIVGRMHVGVSDDEIRANIRQRALKARSLPGIVGRWSDADIRKAEEYAVKVHHDNRSQYAAVMGGSRQVWKGRKPKGNPALLSPSWRPCSVRRLPSGKVQVKIAGTRARGNPYRTESEKLGTPEQRRALQAYTSSIKDREKREYARLHGQYMLGLTSYRPPMPYFMPAQVVAKIRQTLKKKLGVK